MEYRSVRIKDVIDGINKDYFLPAIQRELVWEPAQIEKLFDPGGLSDRLIPLLEGGGEEQGAVDDVRVHQAVRPSLPSQSGSRPQ